MSEWQPIKTAPKDGAPILVAYHGHGESHVIMVRWNETVASRTGRHWDYINSHDGDPQYWMPLPSPPQGLEGAHCNCDCCIGDE